MILKDCYQNTLSCNLEIDYRPKNPISTALYTITSCIERESQEMGERKTSSYSELKGTQRERLKRKERETSDI